MNIRSHKNDKISEGFIDNLLNAQDCEVIALDADYRTIRYANLAATRHAASGALAGTLYRETFAKCFPTLIEKCVKYFDRMNADGPISFEASDEKGEVYNIRATSMTWLDSQDAVVIFLRNASNYERVRKELEILAYYDTLTAIPNRRSFLQDFQRVQEQIELGRLEGCVAILDIDDFKAVNDTYGHNTGDILLNRLVEHLCSYPEFKDRLYRIGGDEFLFFFAEPPSRHGNLKQYLERKFSMLSLSYSLPYIERICSASIGVAMFPEHGVTVSELMRKADIALYKSKELGKNQIHFFQDSLETAKKFLDVYINIQPILRQDNVTYAYELMDQGFRLNLMRADETPVLRFDHTIDMLQPDDLHSGVKYFIAFNMQLLSHNTINTLTRENIVVVIFGTDAVGQTLLNNYLELKKHGYTVALERFSYSVDRRLLEIADIIKIDFSLFSDDEHQRLISIFPAKTLIAKNVDTPEQFERAKLLGYKLFEGFYFCYPVVKKAKVIEPLKLSYLRLLEICCGNEELDMKEIASIISMDIALSYKLLRQLNNVSSGMRQHITSIDLALNYMGEEHLRKWVSLLALRGISGDMPIELVRLSIIRAKFAETLAPLLEKPRDPQQMFLSGLLSLLDVAMEMPFKEVLSDLALNPDIILSLLGKNGPYSDMLTLCRNYECGNWDEVTAFVNANGLSSAIMNDAYLSSIKWVNDHMSEGGLL